MFKQADSTYRARLGRFVVMIAAALTVLSLYTLVSQLPESALTLPGEESFRPVSRSVLTQGWSFFTKSPTSVSIVPYRWSPDGRWTDANSGPQAAARNLFGLDRSARSQGVEIGVLDSEVSDADWKDCDKSIDDCLSGMQAMAIGNRTLDPSLCGSIALVSSRPVPWAWRDVPDLIAPSRVVRLAVECGVS